MDRLLRLLLLFSFVGFSSRISAQNWQVKEMHEDIFDLDASTNERLDTNKKPCALIKVRIVADEVSFSGHVVGNVNKNESEYWIYMPEESSSLRIIFADDTSLDVNFLDYIDSALKSKVTYILVIVNSSNQIQLEKYYLAGIDYRDGSHGHPKDLKMACSMFERAAEQGHSSAQYELGNIIYTKTRGSKQWESIPWFQKAAEQGNVRAQKRLFWIYYSGPQKDSLKAEFWLKRIENYLTHIEQYKLATRALEKGDMDEADKRFKKYFEGKGERAYEIYEIYIGKNLKSEAIEWLNKAVELEDVNALRKLASYYYRGYIVSKDDEKVVELLEKAAERKSYLAMYDLKVFYENNKDEKKKSFWWKKIPKDSRSYVVYSGSILVQQSTSNAKSRQNSMMFW